MCVLTEYGPAAETVHDFLQQHHSVSVAVVVVDAAGVQDGQLCLERLAVVRRRLLPLEDMTDLLPDFLVHCLVDTVSADTEL